MVLAAGAAAQERSGGDGSALAGPRIGERGRADPTRTLVHRDFDGKLKRLEVHPVAAAVDLVALSADEKATVEKVLLDRSLAIEKIIRENVKVVVEAQGAFQPGDDGRGQAAIVKLYQLGQPVFSKGKVVDLVAAVLPAEKARELRRVVGQYMDAAVADRMAGNVDGKKSDRFGAFVGENMTLFGKEVETAAKRTFEGGEKDFRELSKKLDLTAEQESKIQAMFVTMMTKDYGQAGKGEQMRVLLSAYSLLTDEQRGRLREIMAEEARDAARRAKSSKSAKQQNSK